MIFYMLRDKVTGLWYQRSQGSGWGGNWVTQEEASVWTTLAGPQGAWGAISCHNRRVAGLGSAGSTIIREPPEIVTISTNQPKVTFVNGDDWQGVYLDGKLERQGHHIRIDDLLRLFGIDGEQIYADDAWLAKQEGLPENLDEVKQG